VDKVWRLNIEVEHLPVEEEKGAEGLVFPEGRRDGVCGGGDRVVDGKVSEEALDLLAPHFRGVAVMVKENESSRPREIGVLGAQGVVAEADCVTELFEKGSGLGFHGEGSPEGA